jgi:adenylate kinase family enzyme
VREDVILKNVIHIFGASGSGTTTLGKKISEELGYIHMDTDDYFWMPTDPKYTQKRPIDERIALMTRDIENAENVVISGSLVDWGDVLIPYFTLAVRIDIDPDLRIARLIARERGRYGSRIDEGGDMYRQHTEFVKWARSYDTGGIDMRSRAKHDEWQKLLSCRLLRIDGADTVEENFEKVKKYLV